MNRFELQSIAAEARRYVDQTCGINEDWGTMEGRIRHVSLDEFRREYPDRWPDDFCDPWPTT